MRVVDAEGQFVGFVRSIAGQDLVISRPSADDITVPIATCELSADLVKLSLAGHEVAKMGHREQDDWWTTNYRR